MARLACVDVPALPLQLLLREHPAWRTGPVAVVADDRAQAELLWVNRRAWQSGLRPGLRHGAALSLASDLNASTVAPARVAEEVRSLTRRLNRFSPHVEPSREQPGTFWLDGAGLGRLYPDHRAWGEAMGGELARAGLQSSVVVGHDRFACHALTKVRRGVVCFSAPKPERDAARQVPLERLGLPPRTREALHQLAVFTLADLLALPPVGLLTRFGPQLYRLHRLASGALTEGLQPEPEELPVREEVVLEYPEEETGRLLSLVEPRVEALLATLAGRREVLRALHLRLLLEGARPRETVLRPAAATREPALVLELLRLRLEGMELEAGVNGVELLAEGERWEHRQLSLLTGEPRRDLEAADRALARLRAEFGEEAVVRAQLQEAHLPAAGFCWTPLVRVASPAPRPAPGPVQVRRILAQPRVLEGEGEALLNTVSLNGLPLNTVPFNDLPLNSPPLSGLPGGGGPVRWHGPYPLSGGWWQGGQHRDYYFAETGRGAIYWLYLDRKRRRWVLQGRVE